MLIDLQASARNCSAVGIKSLSSLLFSNLTCTSYTNWKDLGAHFVMLLNNAYSRTIWLLTILLTNSKEVQMTLTGVRLTF